MGTAVPPAARIRSTVSTIVPGSGDVPGPADRAATATAAPTSLNRRAISAPMPRLPPVTMATLPSRMPMLFSLDAAVRGRDRRPPDPDEPNTRRRF